MTGHFKVGWEAYGYSLRRTAGYGQTRDDQGD